MKRLITCQPIFHESEKVAAYELKFGFETAELLADDKIKEELSENIRVCLFGSAKPVPGKHKDVFVEITPELLLGLELRRFSRKGVIFYLSQPFEYDERHLEAIKRWKVEGFKVALGSYVIDNKYDAMSELTNMVVVDFRSLEEDDLRTMAVWCKSMRIQTVAYNLETRSAFENAVKLGHNFFHGTFFCEAVYVEKDDIPGFKLKYLRLLQEINQEDVSFDKLDSIIRQDVALTNKLLKYINSAAFGLQNEVESVQHALKMLGTNQVKKWASLVTITNIGKDLPEEALATCLLRGIFLEELGMKLGYDDRGNDLFFMGIFSMIDLFFSRPLEEVLNDIPIKADMKAAILGGEGDFAKLLALVRSYEEGDWDALHTYITTLGLPEDEIPGMYFNAMDWTQNFIITE
ncbi:MAG: HDOD domain-containing protein [Candidatus Marinimicrobia bacterium]|nr:HDOD domain-containing protein [Candidatus Neomarinimicrobiota bacterium]